MHSKISVIVPVYKAEKYLHRCVDSILAQSYTNFELLLINDGSPDNCGVICNEYAAKDSRVRVFHKENGGVSSARNLGLDKAMGEWVAFVDSDDWLTSECLKQLTDYLDADMIKCSIKSSDGEYWCSDDNLYMVKIYLEKYSQNNLIRTPCGTLYKRKIIEDYHIRFDQLIRYGEDIVFNLSYLYNCNTVRLIDEFGYIYFQSGDSCVIKYNLSINEVKYAINSELEIRKKNEERFGVLCESDSVVQFYIEMTSILEMTADDYFYDYFQLYKDITFNFDEESFYNSNSFSPIIRGISQLKRKYEDKLYTEAQLLSEALLVLCSNVKQTPCFIHKDFYIWFYLLKYRSLRMLERMMKIYFYLKRVIK